MNIGIVGTRDFSDYELLCKTINYLNVNIKTIISGGAKGADSLGEKYANENNVETIIYKPNWDKYGKSAGYIRNKEIVNASDLIIAFWDGVSKGTKHSIDISIKSKKPLIIILYKNNKFIEYNSNYLKKQE